MTRVRGPLVAAILLPLPVLPISVSVQRRPKRVRAYVKKAVDILPETVATTTFLDDDELGFPDRKEVPAPSTTSDQSMASSSTVVQKTMLRGRTKNEAQVEEPEQAQDPASATGASSTRSRPDERSFVELDQRAEGQNAEGAPGESSASASATRGLTVTETEDTYAYHCCGGQNKNLTFDSNETVAPATGNVTADADAEGDSEPETPTVATTTTTTTTLWKMPLEPVYRTPGPAQSEWAFPENFASQDDWANIFCGGTWPVYSYRGAQSQYRYLLDDAEMCMTQRKVTLNFDYGLEFVASKHACCVADCPEGYEAVIDEFSPHFAAPSYISKRPYMLVQRCARQPSSESD